MQATNHYLNQWWLDYRRIYASLGLNELTLCTRTCAQPALCRRQAIVDCIINYVYIYMIFLWAFMHFAVYLSILGTTLQYLHTDHLCRCLNETYFYRVIFHCIFCCSLRVIYSMKIPIEHGTARILTCDMTDIKLIYINDGTIQCVHNVFFGFWKIIHEMLSVDKMAATLADDNFKCMFLNENGRISIRSHRKLFPGVQLTISQHWFSKTHYLNQCWLSSLTHICDIRGRWVNKTLFICQRWWKLRRFASDYHHMR